MRQVSAAATPEMSQPTLWASQFPSQKFSCSIEAVLAAGHWAGMIDVPSIAFLAGPADVDVKRWVQGCKP